ncbi:spore coat U domain-containing protein [Sphingobium sp. BYY-5]|uniref:Csu type fimbrial protein n=1 Tax=Sphingobium sp. BYY-5 TaxID=2926400 RepID=UPI001FA73322|nr:spore coat U domain-containing protein [Sphingobium sp. BYY-5]MCI4590294.1 spore coat U domain-containing protein [Sphingobium sp. BYY-5]
MPMIRHAMAAAALLLGLTLRGTPAMAQTYGTCTVAASTIDLGDTGSFTVGSQSQTGSGASGLSCTTLLSLLATSYVKVHLDSSTFLLTGPTDQTIPFTLSTTAGGPPIPVGAEADLSTTALLTLFSGPNNSIPLFIRTSPTTGLTAGTYTGTVTIRWYFSVCTVALTVVCLGSSNSPGFNRGTTPITWGTGAPVTVTVTLDVLPDCQITAPDLAFGAAPLVGSFRAVTRTISVRCSRGAAYSVGLGDGQNFSGTRRMRRAATSDYLKYEIYRGASVSAGRWGSAIAGERRSSATADSNPGIHDSSTLQGFTYSAVIDPTQPTPTAGDYADTIIVDIAF